MHLNCMVSMYIGVGTDVGSGGGIEAIPQISQRGPDGLCLDQNRPPESLSQDISGGDGVAVGHLLGV